MLAYTERTPVAHIVEITMRSSAILIWGISELPSWALDPLRWGSTIGKRLESEPHGAVIARAYFAQTKAEVSQAYSPVCLAIRRAPPRVINSASGAPRSLQKTVSKCSKMVEWAASITKPKQPLPCRSGTAPKVFMVYSSTSALGPSNTALE